jgi:hypothetical protein
VTATAAELGRAVIEVITAALEDLDQAERRYEAALREVRAAGYRIVTHVNHYDGTDDGPIDWQVLDAETREVLAAGTDTGAEHGIDDVWRDDWFHEDGVDDVADAARPGRPERSFALPEGIVGGLFMWVLEDPDAARRALDELGAS